MISLTPRLSKLLATCLLLLLLAGITSQPVFAANAVNGAQIFSVNCAGCHPKGGNIIRRGKNLKSRAMRRNGMDSLEAVVFLVTHGKNNMSAYQERLTPEEIAAVSAYVLEQAKLNWHS